MSDCGIVANCASTMPTESFLFENKERQPGPRLLVFGAVHGNEPCGPVAIRRVIANIENGTLSLKRGSVRFVPIANPDAYREKKRLMEKNLNRVFRKTVQPSCYEERVANELAPLVDRDADMLLDVHSSSASGPVSVFIDYPTPENEALAATLGAEYALLDWPKVYENNPYGFESYDTTRYANDVGIPSVLVECGQHDDPKTVDVAEAVILRAMAHTSLIDSPAEQFAPPRAIRMQTLEKKLGAGDRFEREWRHLESVPAGTRIATRESGEALVAKRDSIIILPKHGAKPGEEWFYLGRAE